MSIITVQSNTIYHIIFSINKDCNNIVIINIYVITEKIM